MKAPLLVDTCALIWIAGAGERHLGKAEEVLDSARAAGLGVFLSPMTAWEIGMLAAKGRLRLAMPAKTWLARISQTAGMEWTEMTIDILLSSSNLPGTVQGDPADRIIIATARELGLCLLTRDRKTLDYARQGHVMAQEC